MHLKIITPSGIEEFYSRIVSRIRLNFSTTHVTTKFNLINGTYVMKIVWLVDMDGVVEKNYDTYASHYFYVFFKFLWDCRLMENSYRAYAFSILKLLFCVVEYEFRAHFPKCNPRKKSHTESIFWWKSRCLLSNGNVLRFVGEHLITMEREVFFSVACNYPNYRNVRVFRRPSFDLVFRIVNIETVRSPVHVTRGTNFPFWTIRLKLGDVSLIDRRASNFSASFLSSPTIFFSLFNVTFTAPPIVYSPSLPPFLEFVVLTFCRSLIDYSEKRSDSKSDGRFLFFYSIILLLKGFNCVIYSNDDRKINKLTNFPFGFHCSVLRSMFEFIENCETPINVSQVSVNIRNQHQMQTDARDSEQYLSFWLRRRANQIFILWNVFDYRPEWKPHTRYRSHLRANVRSYWTNV